MAVERWTDDKDVGKRLAAHRLTGRLSVDLEGSESTLAIVIAAAPGQVLERTAADVSFLAGMLVDKFRYHRVS